MSDLSTVLKNRRLAFDMTQQDLAAAMDSTQSYVCELERGASQPRLPMLERWADALAMDVKLVDRMRP